MTEKCIQVKFIDGTNEFFNGVTFYDWSSEVKGTLCIVTSDGHINYLNTSEIRLMTLFDDDN